MIILPRHKDVAKSRLNLRNPWHLLATGFGSGVNEVLMAHRKPVPVLNIGLPDFFIPQGTQEEARAELGLDAAGIEAKIKAWLA